MKSKLLFLCLTSIFLVSCCDHSDKYFTIDESRMISYADGSRLLYSDSAGVVDTFIVDVLKYQVSGNYESHYKSEKCVEATAYADQLLCRFRNINDTGITQPLKEGYIQRSASSFSYIRSTGVMDGDPHESGQLGYGKNPMVMLNSIELQDGVVVGNKTYDDVYVINSDSITMWFCNKSGLLRYVLPGGYWRQLISQ